jgi:hypothetical protein
VRGRGEQEGEEVVGDTCERLQVQKRRLQKRGVRKGDSGDRWGRNHEPHAIKGLVFLLHPC